MKINSCEKAIFFNIGCVFSWLCRILTNRSISLFSFFFYNPSLYSCNRSFVNLVWMLYTAVELGIYNTRTFFHLKFYSQYFTVLASQTTWTWKPTALTTRPTTTKHHPASLNPKYAHATCGMAKTVRLWGDGTFSGYKSSTTFYLRPW